MLHCVFSPLRCSDPVSERTVEMLSSQVRRLYPSVLKCVYFVEVCLRFFPGIGNLLAADVSLKRRQWLLTIDSWRGLMKKLGGGIWSM